MSSNQLSTEGRIFAAQVRREAQRRERIGSAALGAKGWEPAIFRLSEMIADPAKSPAKRVAILRDAATRLDRVLEENRGFQIMKEPVRKFSKSDKLHFMTVKADYHTFIHMTGLEEALIGQSHFYELSSGHPKGACGQVFANVSHHALGRFYERGGLFIGDRPTVDVGIKFAMICTAVGMIGSIRRNLRHSEINFELDDLIATGSMLVGMHPGPDKVISAFFDCRTVLPREACEDAALEQAAAINAILASNNYMEGEVVFIPMRESFVTQTAAAAQRAMH